MTTTLSSTSSPDLYSDSVQNLHAAIARITPQLKRSAAFRFFQTWSVTPDSADDFYQEAVTALLSTYAEPDETLKGDGLFVHVGNRRMQDHTRRERTYARYVTAMPVVVDEDGEEADYHEFMPSDTLNPEEALIESETRAELAGQIAEVAARLTPVQLAVLRYMASDLKDSEIAKLLGVTRPRISQLKQVLRKAFADLTI
jgi:RNA polymerase sigma factor (sigma-70 family)